MLSKMALNLMKTYLSCSQTQLQQPDVLSLLMLGFLNVHAHFSAVFYV